MRLLWLAAVYRVFAAIRVSIVRDPGRAVQLVFHGARKAPGAAVWVKTRAPENRQVLGPMDLGIGVLFG